jgi:hypothetical protein
MRVGGGGSNITRMCLLPQRGHRNRLSSSVREYPDQKIAEEEQWIIATTEGRQLLEADEEVTTAPATE